MNSNPYRNRPRIVASALTLLAVLSLTAGCSTSTSSSAGKIQVVGVWTGGDAGEFTKILDQSRVDYTYTGSRNLEQLLDSDAEKGQLPDIVILPSLAELRSYSELQTFDPIQESNYPTAWQRLVERPGSAQQDAVIVKADLKGIVWYNPKAFPAGLRTAGNARVAPTWSQLAAVTGSGKPWCMGLGSDSESGWPGADWIAEIMLQTYGPDTYKDWVNGQLPWESPEVTTAFNTWATILHSVPGGPGNALLTNFDWAGLPMFFGQQGCSLDNEGSFITTSYKPGEVYDFFPFPAIGRQRDQSYQVAANFAGMFKKSPAALKLMKFLAGPGMQSALPGMGWFSASQDIAPASYNGPIAEKISKILASKDNSGTRLCFGAADLMTTPMRSAFYQAVLAFASKPSGGTSLKNLLAQLDDVRAAQSHNRPSINVCSS